MSYFKRLTHTLALVVVLLCAFTCDIRATDIPKPLPDPANTPVDQNESVKVFIMMGQSNMVGFGKIGPADTKGTLAYVTKKKNLFPHLLDDEGNWTVRNDVWCIQSVAGRRKDRLQPGFGANGGFIGPELGFSHVLGYARDEMVVVIKATMGNRALGWDLMPPSSRTESPEEHNNQWYQGWQYDIFIKNVHNALKNLPKTIPETKGQDYKVAGFAWWQGHKDQSTPGHVVKDYKMSWPDDYEKNLVNLIKDLRKEFNAPNAPFVLATIAFGGKNLSGGGLKVANAQLAVSGETGKYKEFKGNVKTVEAREFWREASESPANKGYHYNHNAETYMLVGDRLGRAMVDLLEK